MIQVKSSMAAKMFSSKLSRRFMQKENLIATMIYKYVISSVKTFNTRNSSNKNYNVKFPQLARIRRKRKRKKMMKKMMKA